MRRLLNWMAFSLFSATALLALLLLLAGVSLRANRHEAGATVMVTARVLSVRNFLSDMYAARVGPHVIVFDAGMDPEARALEQLVNALGSDLSAVTDIFLTHGHFDHVAAVRRCHNARIHIGAADADLMAYRSGPHAFVPRLFGTLLSVPAVEATDRLVGSTQIHVGNGEFVLTVPLPGHTPGSYAYLFDGVLFTGDALFIGPRGLELADPEDAALDASTCSSLSQLNDLFRRHRVSEVCTGHRGCAAPEEASRTIESVTLEPGSICPG